MAAESEDPRSMSIRTVEMVEVRSLDSDCCSRMLRAFRIGSPLLTIVENCREKMARSRTFTRLNRLISRLTPARRWETLRGV